MAAGLPALMLLLLTGLTAVNAVSTKAACLDTAREAALAASRGEPGVTAGSRSAPSGAEVTIVVEGGRVRATVRAPVRVLGGRLPAVSVVGVAVAVAEPGLPEPQP
ncbi:TadE family type IV pilus minor pilin [Micromonospora sp. CA-263727]|uniref:TadE family type IV pilus minor pilin n=1 Tax=Micromonospora sp. CA-263727 TaxID=3239967 RepID=UPI003D8FEDFD